VWFNFQYPLLMLPTTLSACRSIFAADPSIPVPDRSRLLALLRNGANAAKPVTATENVARIIRRAEAAHRLSRSLRFVDKLAASGVLPKRKLPGRMRASGFLESDLNELLAGKAI
jgi:predicted DNA-binding transcriptional regulator AlpA